MTQWSFFAQSLDNSSPNIIVRRGTEVAAEDKNGRADFQFELYEARRRAGQMVSSRPTIRMAATAKELILEVDTEQLDCEGRSAPFVAWIDDTRATSAQEAISDVRQFLSAVGRSISRGTESDLQEILATELGGKKKNTQRTGYLIALLLLVLGGAISLVAWVMSRKTQ